MELQWKVFKKHWVSQWTECRHLLHPGVWVSRSRCLRFWRRNILGGVSLVQRLGTFVRKGIEAARLDWEPYGTCYFLPLRIADRLNLVNVWTQPGYVSEWYIYQQLHKDKFDAKTLLCGDFNSFEGNKKRRQVFARMRIAWANSKKSASCKIKTQSRHFIFIIISRSRFA